MAAVSSQSRQFGRSRRARANAITADLIIMSIRRITTAKLPAVPDIDIPAPHASNRHMIRYPAWGKRPAALVCAALLTAGSARAAGIGGSRLDQLPQHWLDEQGQTLEFTNLIGHRVFMSMAYTRCHNVCPTTLGQLQRMQAAVDARGEQASFVVIGYDADNDDPASWRLYRASRRLARDNWHFLTGTRQAVQRLASQLGFDFWTYDTHVMHDSRIVIFDSQGVFSAALGPAYQSALL